MDSVWFLYSLNRGTKSKARRYNYVSVTRGSTRAQGWVEFYAYRAEGPDRSAACVRGTKFNASHIFITGYKLNSLQWSGPGSCSGTILSW